MMKTKFIAFFIPFFLLAIFYLFKVPIGQTPDEPAHLNYIEHIARFGSLPTYDYSGVSHHPPLYYLIQAPLFSIFRNVYILRFCSIIFSFLNLLVIWKLISLIFPQGDRRKDLSLGTAIFCSLVPMYNFMSVGVGNDPLTNLFGSLLIYFSLKSVSKNFDQREFLLWGLTFFLAIFTKVILWPTVFISGMTVFLTQRKKRLLSLLVFVISFVFLSFWFYHNISLYGKWDILGWKKLAKVEYFLVDSRMIEKDPRGWLVIVFHSFWGIFSWFSIYLPLSIYSMLRKMTIVFFVPYFIFLLDFFKTADQKKKTTLLLFHSFFILVFFALVMDNFNFFHPQGRYLFSVISVIGFFYTASIYQIAVFLSKLIFKFYKSFVFYFLLLFSLIPLNFLSLIIINNYFSR